MAAQTQRFHVQFMKFAPVNKHIVTVDAFISCRKTNPPKELLITILLSHMTTQYGTKDILISPLSYGCEL